MISYMISHHVFIPPFSEVLNLVTTEARKEVPMSGILKTFKSISTLDFGQGLVFHFSSSGKKNLECQKLSDSSLSNPVSSMTDEQTEVELDISQKHTRNCSIASDDSISSMCSFQSFSDSIESLSPSTRGNEKPDSPIMSKFVMGECPPGGENSVILYTTSLTGIRKTFEDCNAIRFLLQSFKIKFSERDVSIDLELRNELWRAMGERVIPPRLFIKGQYIGGAEEVVGLHEQEKLHKLLNDIEQVDKQHDQPCQNCFNIGFVLCSVCNGSCKVPINFEPQDLLFSRCSYCNENGLVRCITCS